MITGTENNAGSEKSFLLRDVLSVITGRLMCDVEGLYGVLSYMHGVDLYTHQLPRACRDAMPFLHLQFPQWKDANCENVTEKNWQTWLAEQERLYGTQVILKPIPGNELLRRNPVTEAVEMFKQVIVVEGDVR